MSEPLELVRQPVDPADPYVREAQTFPCLSDDMIARVAAYGKEEQLPAGTAVYHSSDRGVDFFLVLDGEIEMFTEGLGGKRDIFALHRAGQFTGEVNLLNGREILVNGVARVESRVVRVPRPAFLRMMSAEPDIAEIIMRAFILRRVGIIRYAHGGVDLIGDSHCADTLRLQRFMSRNGYPFRIVNPDVDPASQELMRTFGIGQDDLPAVILPGGEVLRDPRRCELADRIGLTEPIDEADLFDVAVVGAGPAGLAAAVYAASEGLRTIVIEQEAPGGQAGTSSRIENYLGFPTGISGHALAGRAQVQAQKFGAHLAISRAAAELHCEERPYRIRLDDDRIVRASSIVVATGARYSKLDLPNYDKFEGQGIHYAATAMEAQLCEGQEVVIVGGGNSAGQAAMYLSRTVAHVHILVRSKGLASTMSDYLVRRIETSPKITVHAFTEVTELLGEQYLEKVTWTNRQNGQSETRPIGSLFVMIGAQPNTQWLQGCLPLDPKGFILTGKDEQGIALDSPFVTTTPGIFAVGDVRSGSVKRVASGVGEGSVVVQAVHRYLHPGAA